MTTLRTPGYDTATWIDVNTDTGVSTKPELLLNRDAIQNSLNNLLRTRIGSRRMLREYGTYLHYFLHEPMDAMTAANLQSSLVQSIERWEPRIKLNLGETVVLAKPSLPGFEVRLSWSELRTGGRDSQLFIIRRLI